MVKIGGSRAWLVAEVGLECRSGIRQRVQKFLGFPRRVGIFLFRAARCCLPPEGSVGVWGSRFRVEGWGLGIWSLGFEV